MTSNSLAPSNSPFFPKLDFFVERDPTGWRPNESHRLKMGWDENCHIAAIQILNSVQSGNCLRLWSLRVTRKYVEIYQGRHTLFLNLRSFQKRLGADPKELVKAHQKGALLPLIEDISEIARKTVLYSPVVADLVKYGVHLIVKSDSLENSNPDLYHTLNFPDFDEIYQLRYDKSQKKIVLLFGILLGSGTFADVYNFIDLIKKNHLIIKIPSFKNDGEEAKKQLLNEYKVLHLLHEKGKVWGIKAKPRKMIQLTNGRSDKSSLVCAYIDSEQYDSDYDFFLRHASRILKKTRKLSELYKDIYQILFGLKQLFIRNVLHGDIKPSNLLVQKRHFYLAVVLSDFGGAIAVDESLPFKSMKRSFLFQTATPVYSLRSDFEERENVKKRKDIWTLGHSQDIFSTGVTLQKILTGRDPFTSYDNDVGGRGFPYPDSYLPISKSRYDVPKMLRVLIRKMLRFDHRKRPNAVEVFNEYEKFLITHKPKLLFKLRKLKSDSIY